MGHAGAIISAFGESAPEKVEILREAGVTIAPTPAELGNDHGGPAGPAARASPAPGDLSPTDQAAPGAR